MKHTLWLLLFLFCTSPVYSSSIWIYPFSKRIIDSKAYFICSYVRSSYDSAVFVDKQSGRILTVPRTGDALNDTSSYLVIEGTEKLYLSNAYPAGKQNDQLVKQLAEQIRSINSMPGKAGSEQQFRACKKWIFALMKVSFLQWEGLYEWRNNQIIRDYIVLHKNTLQYTEYKAYDILTPKEKERLYNTYLHYHWPNYYTWDAMALLGKAYNERIVLYVQSLIEWMFRESGGSVCGYCAVNTLIERGIGGKVFLAIAEEYRNNAGKLSPALDSAYMKRLLGSLESR